MGKHLNNNDLNGRRTSRSLLAVSLAASLAAFGCTTNQNLGNGTPVRSGGELRSAPTSGVTSGQERATPPPMTSSYTGASALPRVTPRSASRADQAAAILAGHQAVRGRYLGVVNPGASARGYVSDQFAAYQPTNPALLTNPQLTLNSSLTSGPTVAINGTGDGGGGTLVTGASGLGTGVASGASAASVVAGDIPLGSPALGPALPAGAFAATTLTPTAAISGTPAVTAASVGAGRTGGVAPLAGTTALGTTGRTAGTATTINSNVANTNTNAVSSGSVRIIRGANGRATITNTTTSTSDRNP